MQKIQMSSFASMDYRHTEKGFTFVSVLFTIFMFSISLPLLSYMLQAVDTKSNYSEISVQQFFLFVRDDMINATNVHVTNGRLSFFSPHEEITASLELYGTFVRRQVNGQGHEIYLRDVEGLSFTSLPYGVQVTVITTSGEKYEKKIAYYN